jgi:hypothetical protein
MRVLLSLILVTMLGACSGSSGGATKPKDMILASPRPDVVTSIIKPDVAEPTITPDPLITPITLGQINANAASFSDLISDISARSDLTELAPLDTVAVVRANGAATFEGAFYVFIDAARFDGFVGQCTLKVGFEDPNAPSVNGGASGFVFVDGPELAAVLETGDFIALPDDTPVFAATGDVTFSNGELANTAGVATAEFSIAGELASETGPDQTEQITIEGGMVVLFDGNRAFGVGGSILDPDFDLERPEAFFFGVAND